jgi:Glyoxalase-like domain
MAIARYASIVLDCPDPAALATFYGAMLDAGEAAVVELGATKHEHQPGTSFRVFLDPAGHPFCLCVD